MSEIDVNAENWYEHDKPEKIERTKKRLQDMVDIGFTEVGIAHFGLEDIVSGFYIETVWSNSEEAWDKRIKWAKGVIKNFAY